MSTWRSIEVGKVFLSYPNLTNLIYGIYRPPLLWTPYFGHKCNDDYPPLTICSRYGPIALKIDTVKFDSQLFNYDYLKL